MRPITFIVLLGLITPCLASSQGESPSQFPGFTQGNTLFGASEEKSTFLPPAPPQARPITEQYLSQLGANHYPAPPSTGSQGDIATPVPQHSRLPRAPYPSNMPTYTGNPNQVGPGQQLPMQGWGGKPNTQPPQQDRGWTAPSLSVDEVDPGDELPPELAKERTMLQRQSRQENHALVGELMAAQDKVEDLMNTERPSPEAVGEAYARIFDIQRRMIELRVRTRNALLDIWDKAGNNTPEWPALPLKPTR